MSDCCIIDFEIVEINLFLSSLYSIHWKEMNLHSLELCDPI